MALALTGPVTKEQIKSTCYYNIEASTPSTIDWDNVIGQGTYGIILGTIIEDNWVVKIANKKGSCTSMDHEHKLHESAFNALARVNETLDLPIICPQIRDFKHIESCCWYYMSRIFNPPDFTKLVHCLIYGDDKTSVKWSGVFPSVDDLSVEIEQFKETNKIDPRINDINDIAYCNGVIFGLLHYGSRQTAQDIEIVLGKDKSKGKVSMFFYDFDKSASIEEFDDNMIKTLTTSMSGSYSNFLDPVGERFKQGYMDSATIFGFEEYSNRVIEQCTKFQKMLDLDSDDEMVGGYGKKNKSKTKSKTKKNTKRKTKNKKKRTIRNKRFHF